LARAVVDAIRAAVPLREEMQAMDFGAGTGLVTLGLLSGVRSVTAVDASCEMLRVLEEKLHSMRIGNGLNHERRTCMPHRRTAGPDRAGAMNVR
jgi:ubiquinone/menaquinone biosynthesis C-methylase UbiE